MRVRSNARVLPGFLVSRSIFGLMFGPYCEAAKARQNQMVFGRDEISNMWVPDIQHEAHDAPFHVRIDASFKQDTKGITNAGRWRLIASASARDWLREGDP